MQDCAFRHWLDANAEAIDRGLREPGLLTRVGLDALRRGEADYAARVLHD